MTPAQVLDVEVEVFTGLIEEINDLGTKIPELSPALESTEESRINYSCKTADRKRSVQASEKEKIGLMV
jgi:hypothetical protein